MTSEIAILNKDAIALAADSAVTVTLNGDKKIFPSANKLFMLSKFHPIGAMIYGKATFMDISWEKLFKLYRKDIKNNKFKTINEYAINFLEYLERNKQLCTEEQEEDYFSQMILIFFNRIRQEIRELVDLKTQNGNEIDDTEIKRIVTSVVSDYIDKIESAEIIETLSNEISDNDLCEILETKYCKVVDKIFDFVFEKIPITPNTRNRIKRASYKLFDREVDIFPKAGIVIAGFGESEIFPCLESFLIEGMIEGKLKYKRFISRKTSVKQSAAIVPFAQSEMVYSFMEGIDPSYHSFLDNTMKSIFNLYKTHIFDYLEAEYGEVKSEFKRKITLINNELLDTMDKNLQNWRKTNNIDPVIKIVDSSPKTELAAMAESLVNLTSFKKKVSPDSETVGGPIDVAVISKGDGFIWIKRKHYFNPELNHHFFDNYYLEGNDEEKL